MIAYTTPNKQTQMCDECGRQVLKIWRIHKNYRYCCNCYARVFKRAMCHACGNYARLNKYDSNAVCTKCLRLRPCARCGKKPFKSGKQTEYGLVCNVCAAYFREQKPCELCGTLSNRLSKLTRLGHDLKICPKCQRADHATCHACKRYRLLTKNDDGRMLCSTCLKHGEVSCFKCQQPMPAGYGKTCEACYWKALLVKRTNINCASLKSLVLVSEFKAFAEWLGLTVGQHKAAITINRYVAFFIELDMTFASIPNYSELVGHFGAAKLRKVELPMRWLELTNKITVDIATREENTEKRRIAILLSRFETESIAHKLLSGYYQHLMRDLTLNKTTLRSIRLALSPSANVLSKATEMGFALPNQKVLYTYLCKSAGQRAAVSGFVNYLRKVHGIDIKLPKLDAKKAQLNRRKRLEAEMLTLMKAGKANADNREWLSVALAYFHGLPKKVGITIPLEAIVESNDGGIKLDWRGESYWLQKP